MTAGSRSGKTNTLINLISYQLDLGKIYSCAKDSDEAKYQLLINSNDMDDIYYNIKEYNENKERKILIVFDDSIADRQSNKKVTPILTELFIRGRKINISLAFITQSYFAIAKNIRLNSTH